MSIHPPAADSTLLEDSMDKVFGSVLGVAIAFGGWACSAQEALIPFDKIARNTQFSAELTMPAGENSSNAYSSSSSPTVAPLEPAMASFVRVPPVKYHRPFMSGFFLLNGLEAGMAVLDVETTHHCIADHHCQEGNPLMPSNQAGALGVNLGLVAYSTFVSHKLKKHGNKFWWIAPVAGISSHGVGVASGLAHW
jgi:hypothetical protein